MSTKPTKLLQVYIEAEDYLRLKQHVSSSKGMSKFVRTLLKAYLDRLGVTLEPRTIHLMETLDAAEHAAGPGSAGSTPGEES